jgi:2-polyprenyl-3-methyl-5-hydroxy-6-metoxy-1,4-benzoquinol methylase
MNIETATPGFQHSLERKLRVLHGDFATSCDQTEIDRIEKRLQQLRDIVGCPHCHRTYSTDWNDERETLLRALQSRAALNFGFLEKSAAEKLSGDYQSINRYLKEVSHTAIRHAEVADVSHRSRVLFIGCGALPLSCHVLARHFGCEVVGLDADSDAVERAKEITRAGYGKRLTLLQGRGEEFPANGFSHVIVAALVPHKEEILSHLHRFIDPGSKVVCRFGNGLQRLINYPLSTGPREEWQRLWLLGDLASLYQTLILARR